MRAQCPVHEVGPGRFMALDHKTVQTGLRSVAEFGGSAGQYGLPEEDTSVAGLPEPRHGWVRRIINSVVAFHKSQQIEPYLSDLCNKLAQDTIAAEGAGSMEGIDVMPLFVDPLPPAAMARLLGFPAEDSSRYYQWGAQLGMAFAEAVPRDARSPCVKAARKWLSTSTSASPRELLLRTEDWPNDALSRFLGTAVDGEDPFPPSDCHSSHVRNRSRE